MIRRLLCKWFGHAWFTYEDADYADCTRCGAVKYSYGVEKAA